jgi:hypothetical protein
VTCAVPRDAAWTRIDLADPAAHQWLATELVGFANENQRHTLFHDLAWLLEAEGRGPSDVRIYVYYDGQRLRAYAPFVIQSWSLRFRVGELSLYSVPFERLHIHGGPMTAAADCEDDQRTLVTGLLALLRPQLGHHQAIYLEGVSLGGAVEHAIAGAGVRSLYHILEPSPRYERRLIRFPSSYEEYLRSRKRQTRLNLRNSQHKLQKHLNGDVRLVRCVDVDKVPDFVRSAVTISKKTYQWRLLGLGLRDPVRLQNTLAAMALHGWTRCYLLECGGTPTAFMVGYLYEGTYYYVDVGFDPAWEKWSVGTVLHLEVLRDLIDGDGQARAFDFSSGSGVHKQRFSNESTAEANLLLLPKCARNLALVAAYEGVDTMASAAVRLLEKLQVKTIVKKLVRRGATGRSAD